MLKQKIKAEILNDFHVCNICGVRTKKVVTIGFMIVICGACVIEMFQKYLSLDNMNMQDVRKFLDKAAMIGRDVVNDEKDV